MRSILSTAWRYWLKFAETLGNIQMVVLLTIIYWTGFLVLAIPFKLLSDPLSLKRPGGSRWIDRTPIADVLESMRKQG